MQGAEKRHREKLQPWWQEQQLKGAGSGWGRWVGKKEEEEGGREGGRMCVYTRGLIYVTDMGILAKETQCCCL